MERYGKRKNLAKKNLTMSFAMSWSEFETPAGGKEAPNEAFLNNG